MVHDLDTQVENLCSQRLGAVERSTCRGSNSYVKPLKDLKSICVVHVSQKDIIARRPTNASR